MKAEQFAIPTDPGHRLVWLDALRGSALLGILFVNMTWFSGTAVLSEPQRAAALFPLLDRVADFAVHVVVYDKFWSLFALLFGIGFGLQVGRGKRVTSATRRFAWRMVLLLALGLLHALLLWFGDIVSVYAVVGLGLVAFRRCSARATLWWGAAGLLAPIVVGGLWLGVHLMTRDPLAAAAVRGYGPAELLPVFGAGTYREILWANWAFLKERWLLLLYTGRLLKLLGMFLLGLGAVRLGIVEDPGRHGHLLRRLLLWGLVVGLPLNVVVALITPLVPLRPPSMAGWVVASLRTVAVPTLALGYAAALVVWFRSARGAWLLRFFSAAGRMSLSNYLLQSVAGVLIFYGSGLGLWQHYGMSAVVVFAVVLFSAQVLFSLMWLRWARFGPIEWMWRCLTYRRWISLRRAEAAARQPHLPAPVPSPASPR